jgi:hypothetical protein
MYQVAPVILTRGGVTFNQRASISSERLPRELVALVFCHGQRMARDAEDDDYPTPSSLPKFEVTISHVSSYWRDVAINQGVLWANIHLSPRTSLAELEAYLLRSAKCLLNVRVDTLDGVSMDRKLDMLTHELPRWKRFSVGRDNRGHENALFERLKGSTAPLLEHMSIYVDAQEHLECMQSLTSGAKSLSFVRLGGRAMPFFLPPINSMVTLHLDQTAHLPMSYQRFFQVLTASPVLANLSIHGDIIGTAVWPPTTGAMDPIEMPALRSLRICGIGGPVYCVILLSISAPGLESIVLKDVFDHDLDQLWDSPQMTARSPKFPALTSLTFFDFDFTESTYRKLFQVFPAITHFTSYAESSPPRVLKLLGDGGSGGGGGRGGIGSGTQRSPYPPWPNLHTITFYLQFDDEDSINAMVEKRMHLEHPIMKIRLGAETEERLSHMLGQVERLKEFVILERFIDVDPWPVDLPYIDEDDRLFH